MATLMVVAACLIWVVVWVFKSCPCKRITQNKGAAFARPFFMGGWEYWGRGLGKSEMQW